MNNFFCFFITVCFVIVAVVVVVVIVAIVVVIVAIVVVIVAIVVVFVVTDTVVVVVAVVYAGVLNITNNIAFANYGMTCFAFDFLLFFTPDLLTLQSI